MGGSVLSQGSDSSSAPAIPDGVDRLVFEEAVAAAVARELAVQEPPQGIIRGLNASRVVLLVPSLLLTP